MREILPDKTEMPSFKMKESRKDYVAVTLDKSKNQNLIKDLHLAIMWALGKAGVKNLDLTIRENEDNYEIIIET